MSAGPLSSFLAAEITAPIAPGEKMRSLTPCSVIAWRMSARWSPSS